MDNAQGKSKCKFGLVGKNIDYSFSRNYFASKFEAENLPCTYVNFDLEAIDELKNIIKNTSNLKGLNVTIPYKEQVIPLLDAVHKKAKAIGAVNTIKIEKNGRLKGYNTDYYGFKNSLQPHLKPYHKKALILGTGGASKAIAYGLERLEIPYVFVSRSQKDKFNFLYDDLNDQMLSDYTIIVNCTPIGTYPNITACPNIPYRALTDHHLLYDLVYNPKQSEFLKRGFQKGAMTINGAEMLRLQAEKAWEIWNKP